MNETTIRAVGTTSVTLVRVLKAVATLPHQDVRAVAKFADVSDLLAERGLTNLESWGLVARTSNGRFACTQGGIERGTPDSVVMDVLRRALLAYPPFRAIRDGLLHGEPWDQAATRASLLLGIGEADAAKLKTLRFLAREMGLLDIKGALTELGFAAARRPDRAKRAPTPLNAPEANGRTPSPTRSERMLRRKRKPPPRLATGSTVAGADRLEEAAMIQRETMKLFPHDVVARNGLAETLKEMGHLDEALTIQRETAALFPDDLPGRISLADTLARMGQLDEAERVYRQLMASFPANPVVRNGLADTLRRSATPVAASRRPERSPAPGRYRYQVALSFAGEDRPVASEVARMLASQGISVFYDEYEEATLWGRDLYTHLADVYSQQAQYCLVFISRHYAGKLWTRHELQQAQARAFKEYQEYLLPIRLDDTRLPGLPETIVYVDLRQRPLAMLVKLVLQKLGDKAAAPVSSSHPAGHS